MRPAPPFGNGSRTDPRPRQMQPWYLAQSGCAILAAGPAICYGALDHAAMAARGEPCRGWCDVTGKVKSVVGSLTRHGLLVWFVAGFAFVLVELLLPGTLAVFGIVAIVVGVAAVFIGLEGAFIAVLKFAGAAIVTGAAALVVSELGWQVQTLLAQALVAVGLAVWFGLRRRGPAEG